MTYDYGMPTANYTLAPPPEPGDCYPTLPAAITRVKDPDQKPYSIPQFINEYAEIQGGERISDTVELPRTATQPYVPSDRVRLGNPSDRVRLGNASGLYLIAIGEKCWSNGTWAFDCRVSGTFEVVALEDIDPGGSGLFQRVP